MLGIDLPAIVAAAVALSAPSAESAAQTADSAALRELLAPMREYAAQFEQVVFDGLGRPLQTATGTMRLQRPGRFRWEVVAPYSQLVVTDGTTVFVFDADLAQVTVQPLDETLRGTPARLLIGSMDALESTFTVVREEDGSFTLHPRDEEALYRRIDLEFAPRPNYAASARQAGVAAMPDAILVGIVIVDHLDQETRVVFANPTLRPEPAPGVFDFHIPDDVDVIGDVPSRSSAR